MAKDFKMPSKKTVIAIITIVILAITAAVGTAVFLNSRGEAEATDFETENVEGKQEETNGTQVGSETQSQENNGTSNQEGEQTTENQEGTENTDTTVEGEETEGNTTDENTETTGTEGTTVETEEEETAGTAENENTEPEQIQEVEITDTQVITIPEKKISEGHLVGWEEIQPIATFVNAIYGEADETDVAKSSETTIGKNVTVSEGIITYYITVKNTTERKLSNIEIKDEIPEKTTYVQDSADNNAKEIKDEEIVKALKWFVDIEANGEKTVSFKVKVNEGETGTVINQATANGDESNKEYTAIIEKKKTAVIKRTIEGVEQIVPEPAQIGDTITFAITIENTGDIAGNTTIRDEQLKDILKDNKAEQIGNLEFYYGDAEAPLTTPVSIKEALEEDAPDAEKEVLTVQDLIDGIEGVKIPQGPNQTVSIVVTVQVKKVDGKKIVNRATIGEKEEIPTNPVEIETIDLSLTKDITKLEIREKDENGKETTRVVTSEDESFDKELVKVGDTITYKIIAGNNGSAILNNVKVLDDKTVTVISAELPERLQAQINGEALATGEIQEGETAQLTTIGKTIVSVDYANTNKDVVADNLLGRNDLTLEPGEKITFIVTYTMEEKDITLDKFINNAKLVGYYKDVPYERTDYEPIETLDTELTKSIEKITKTNADGTTTVVAPSNKDFSKELVEVGDVVTYTIVAKNNSSVTLENVKILDDKDVTVVSVTLPTRLQEEGIQIATIGSKIAGADYGNTNPNEVSSNLLGRNDITLKPGEEITVEVSYQLVESDFTGKNYGQTFINSAKFIGYYEGTPYEKEDDVPVETIDTELTKSIEKITKTNTDGTTTVVAPSNKDFSKELVEIGDVVTYTIVAKNNSSVTLEYVKILDDKDVTVVSVTLPTRLQKEGIQIATIGSKIAGADYENTNPNEVSSNLLGRNDITLKPGEEITVEVSYQLAESDFEGTNFGQPLVNSAKFIGYYEGTPYEKEDDVPVETIDTELTKSIEKITKTNTDGTTTVVAPSNKDFSKELVEIGDVVTYTIVAKNNSSVTLENVKILDDKDVTVVSVTLPTRLQEEGIQIATIGSKIAGADYGNTNPNEVSSNLLGRNDITLKPGEEITVEVSYQLVESDFTGTNFGQPLVNSAKFIGYYEGTPYEKEDDVPVDTIDLSLTKDIIKINGADPSVNGIMPSGIKLTNIGDTITYEIIARNDGSATLNNIKILDDKKVTVESAVLPERLQKQLDEEDGKEGAQLTTIGKTINSTGYSSNSSENLLGRNDLTLEPGEEIILHVTYSLKKGDMVGAEAKEFINNAKFIGYYKDVPHERKDDATVTVEYTPKKGNLVFEKAWDDDNYTANRPTEITVKLQMYVNGQWKDVTTEQREDAVKTLTVTENETTTYKWVGLDLDSKETGETIKYRVVETKVGNVAVEDSAYTQSTTPAYVTLEESQDKKITITNTYTEPSGTILRHYTEQSADLKNAPLDVVFVLDTSNSMNWGTRIKDMTEAVNTAINQIIGYNEYNRVSIVGFSGLTYSTNEAVDGEVLLSLGRYESVSVTKKSTGDANFIKVSASNGNKTVSSASREFTGGTFTQLGIRLGAEQLIRGICNANGEIDNTKREVVIEGKPVTRTPVMILISDGVPTLYTTEYDNVSIFTKNGDTIRESAEEGYYTILSAIHYKNIVTESYYVKTAGTDVINANGTVNVTVTGTETENTAKVLTIGMGISETNTSSTQYGVTVLNPSVENISKCNPAYVNAQGVNVPPVSIADSRGYYTYNAAANLYGCITKGSYNALVNTKGYDAKGAYVTSSATIAKDDQNKINYTNSSYKSYADAAYTYEDKDGNGNLLSGDFEAMIQGWMQNFVTELLPKTFSRDITTEERAQGKVYLDDINTEGTFKLTINGTDYNYAQSSAYLGTETQNGKTREYVNLVAIPAGATISIEYTTGATTTK